MDNLPTRGIPEITQSIKWHAQSAALNLIAIGRDLMDAKAQLDHGTWLPWLKTVGISSRTAENYMRLAQASENIPQLVSIPYSKALALLDAPEEMRTQMLTDGVEDTSAAEIRRLTAQLKAADEQLKKAQGETASAKESARMYQQHLKQTTAALNEAKAAKPAPEVIVKEVPVEKIPEDYEDIKKDLEWAQRAAQEAEEQLEKLQEELEEAERTKGMPDSANVLNLEQLAATCNEVHNNLWAFPMYDWSVVSIDHRNDYRFFVQGVYKLMDRILQAMDAADGIVMDGGDVV